MARPAAKKRRRGNAKVTRKAPKHRDLQVANKVPQKLKEQWDAKISPAMNLANFGLEADPNQTLSNMVGVGRKTAPKGGNADHSAAFMGMTVVPRDDFTEANPKLKIMAEVDQLYAAQLIKIHGNDYAKMHRDIKHNYNQLTESRCKKMCETFNSLTPSERLV